LKPNINHKRMRNSHHQLHVGGNICNVVAVCLTMTWLSAIHSNAVAQSAESRAVLRQSGAGAVSPDRLSKADQEPSQWMASGRDESAAFFSPLKQIDASTASRLGFSWQFKTDTYRGMEATPLVVDGVLYVSGTWGTVYAIDGATGIRKWVFNPHNEPAFARWSSNDVTTRGLTIWQGKVFAVATDCKLYALDARDGHIAWQTQTLAENLPGYACSGAPQIAGHVVVVGNAGGDNLAGGVRGYVSAFDIKNGKLAWRFYTVPKLGDPQPTPELAHAAETWDPKRDPTFGGGGTVWGLMTYDPVLDLLYFGTGNAAPYNGKRDWSGGTSTDRLYAASIIALHAASGRMAWYYQTTPGDVWDYDAAMNLVLARLTIDGKPHQVLMQANKNGYFYVLDRENGHPLSVRPFVYMNWSTGIDHNFRPIVSRDGDYAASPKIVYPSGWGAHSWPPMSYSKTTGLVYIPTIETGNIYADVRTNPYSQLSDVDQAFGVAIFVPDKLFSYEPLEAMVGPLPRFPSLSPSGNKPRLRGVLKAWDPIAGKVAWEQQTSQDYMLLDGGALSTAGGLVFAGREDGHFVVYDAASGRILKDFDTGTAIEAAPMTYSVNGVQYVAILCGHGGSNYFFLGTPAMQYANEGRVLTFALDGAPEVPKPARRPEAPPYAQPPPRMGTLEFVNAGRNLFFIHCARCHTLGVPAISPDLSRSAMVASFDALKEIVLKGVLQPNGMPRFSDVLSAADVSALQGYLIDQWWQAYDEQKANEGKLVH
jgi:quinohemoprotein ethanol dehydrogenase